MPVPVDGSNGIKGRRKVAPYANNKIRISAITKRDHKAMRVLLLIAVLAVFSFLSFSCSLGLPFVIAKVHFVIGSPSLWVG